MTDLVLLCRSNRAGGVFRADDRSTEGTGCSVGVFRPSAQRNHHQHWRQPAVLERWSPQVHIPSCALPHCRRVCSEFAHTPQWCPACLAITIVVITIVGITVVIVTAIVPYPFLSLELSNGLVTNDEITICISSVQTPTPVFTVH